MKKLKLEWVSDKIGDDYLKWKKGDVVLIDSQTGTGKSHFIEHVLLNHCIRTNQSILYIVNRTNLKMQVKRDIADAQGLSITDEELNKMYKIGQVIILSYQSMQEGILDEKYECAFYTNEYDYIVLDEVQYLMADAQFNNKTWFFWNEYVLNKNKNSVIIYMSGTMDTIKEALVKIYKEIVPYDYSTGRDYSYVKTHYFKNIKSLVTFINNDTSGNKWLIFVDNIQTKGKYLADNINNSKVVYSKHQRYSGIKSDQDEVNNIIDKCRFDCKCLIATKALDNGVNLKDPLLTNIVIMAYNKTDFLQMLGRKRIDIDEPETVNLYIVDKLKKSFVGLLNKIKSNQELVDQYNDPNFVFNRIYDTNHKKLPQHLFYIDEGKWQLNKMGVFAQNAQARVYQRIIDKFEKYPLAWIYTQLKWIGQKYNKNNWINNIVDNKKINDIEDYLNSIPDNEPVDKKELIDIINLTDARGRQQKSIEQFNAYFDANRLPYQIFSKKDKRRKLDDGSDNPNRDKSFWFICKNVVA